MAFLARLGGGLLRMMVLLAVLIPALNCGIIVITIRRSHHKRRCRKNCHLLITRTIHALSATALLLIVFLHHFLFFFLDYSSFLLVFFVDFQVAVSGLETAIFLERGSVMMMVLLG